MQPKLGSLISLNVSRAGELFNMDFILRLSSVLLADRLVPLVDKALLPLRI